MNTSPDTPQSLYEKGHSLWQHGKANEAFQYFQKVLSQSDNRPYFLLAITGLLLESGHFPQAIEVLTQFHADTRASSELQLRLALLHMKLEQSETAIDLLKACVEQNPGCVNAYTMLAENYGYLNDNESAEAILDALLQQYPQETEIHRSAASYLSAIGSERAALRAYKLCLEQKNCDAETLSRVARIHFSLGEFDSATHYNLQAINRDANSAVSYLGVATSKKFTPHDEDIVEQFRRTLDRDLKPETITALNFSLGKMHDDLEDYHRAFAYFTNANEAHRKGLASAFELEPIKRQFSSIQHYFTQERIAALQNNSHCDSKPIFILGMPRSGTTLLERIFSADENVFVAGEMETLDLLPKHMQDSTENRIAYPDILSHLPPAAMAYYSDQYLASATPRYKHYRHVLDKNPLNFANIGLIKTLFPQACIIHCKRTPLDNCLSLYFQFFAHKKMDFSYHFDSLAEYYLLYLDMMQHWQSQGVGLLSVQYEELVETPDKIINSLREYTGLAHLGLKAGGEMSAPLHTASVWQARQDVHKNSINRWQNYRSQLAEYRSRYPHLFA